MQIILYQIGLSGVMTPLEAWKICWTGMLLSSKPIFSLWTFGFALRAKNRDIAFQWLVVDSEYVPLVCKLLVHEYHSNQTATNNIG